MEEGDPRCFPTAAHLLVISIRARQAARQSDLPLQPAIAEALSCTDCEMLAPVFDGVLRLFECAMRDPVSAGSADHLSAEERVLITLLAAADHPPAAATTDLFSIFDWSLWSAGVMIDKVLSERRSRISPSVPDDRSPALRIIRDG